MSTRRMARAAAKDAGTRGRLRDVTPTYSLTDEGLFDSLTQREKLYLHHLARAGWYGRRITARQNSPESNGIIDFILHMYEACGGRWHTLLGLGVDATQVESFLEYAAWIITGLGNYNSADFKKELPCVSAEALRRMASISPESAEALEAVIEPMLSPSPSAYGLPDHDHQSGFYPGNQPITKEDLAIVAGVMAQHSIAPENTRVRKSLEGNSRIYDILQASVETSPSPTMLLRRDRDDGDQVTVRLVRGDHAAELKKVCSALSDAQRFAATEHQVAMLGFLIEAFTTGDMRAFKDSQRLWVMDKSLIVDGSIGFHETYRDSIGGRAEWSSSVGINHPDKMAQISRLIEASALCVGKLPWAAAEGEGEGGPFQAMGMNVPETYMNVIVSSCEADAWLVTVLPNYHDIRREYGSKTRFNTNLTGISLAGGAQCVLADDPELYSKFSNDIYSSLWLLACVFGYECDRELQETSPGQFNFDPTNPPISPLSGGPIQGWFKPGQTPRTVFRHLYGIQREMRGDLVGLCLAHDADVAAILGYSDKTGPATAEEFTYQALLAWLGVTLAKFRLYDPHTNGWGCAHNQSAFAIFKHLLAEGGSVISITHDAAAKKLQGRVDRTKMKSHGLPALRSLLLRLHIWYCTADVESLAEQIERLSTVDGEYPDWCRTARAVFGTGSRVKYVQGTTFLSNDGFVEYKQYEASNAGMIQSFYESERRLGINPD